MQTTAVFAIIIIIIIISFINIRKRFFLDHIYRNRLSRPLTHIFIQNIKHIKRLLPNILTKL